MIITIHRLELANEALLGQSERLQERVKRMEEEGQISSRIIQVFCQFSFGDGDCEDDGVGVGDHKCRWR